MITLVATVLIIKRSLLAYSLITRAKQLMGHIENYSKIALGLRKGIQQINPEVNSNGKKKPGEFIEQLDIFSD